MKNLSPTSIFRLDAIGAIITALLHGAVLTRFESIFGIPQQILYTLAGVACLYAIYSTACSFLKPKEWRPFMRVIAIANLLFAIVTAIIVAMHFSGVSTLGKLYFLGEMLLLAFIARFEWKRAGMN